MAQMWEFGVAHWITYLRPLDLDRLYLLVCAPRLSREYDRRCRRGDLDLGRGLRRLGPSSSELLLRARLRYCLFLSLAGLLLPPPFSFGSASPDAPSPLASLQTKTTKHAIGPGSAAITCRVELDLIATEIIALPSISSKNYKNKCNLTIAISQMRWEDNSYGRYNGCNFHSVI